MGKRNRRGEKTIADERRQEEWWAESKGYKE